MKAKNGDHYSLDSRGCVLDLLRNIFDVYLRPGAVCFNVFDFGGIHARFTVDFTQQHLLRFSIGKRDSLLLVSVNVGLCVHHCRIDPSCIGTSLQKNAAYRLRSFRALWVSLERRPTNTSVTLLPNRRLTSRIHWGCYRRPDTVRRD